jgi:hypothetical protein
MNVFFKNPFVRRLALTISLLAGFFTGVLIAQGKVGPEPVWNVMAALGFGTVGWLCAYVAGRVFPDEV